MPSGRGAAIDVFRADLEARAPLRLRGPFDKNSLAACICNGGCLEPWLFAHLWRPGRALGEMILRRLFSPPAPPPCARHSCNHDKLCDCG